MVKRNFDYDLIVIGTGAGGSAAANIVSKSGMKVAVVENFLLGGESPNNTDIPKMALMRIAKSIYDIKKMSKVGVRREHLSYNYPRILDWKKHVVYRTGVKDSEKFYQKLGVDVYKGRAHFLTPNEITVNKKHLSAKYFLIATGSDFIPEGVKNINNINYLTPKTIFSITRPPKSIFIIGGGQESIEIAQILSIFGTKVYISDKSSRLLPREDEEVSIAMENILVEDMNIFALPQTRVLAVEKDGSYKKVIFHRGGQEKSVKVEEILVASSRKPKTDIGLENAHIEYNDNGIIVNSYLQTSMKHIYASGSVVDSSYSTSEILTHSRIAAHNIIKAKARVSLHDNLSPRVIFGYPEVAVVGLTEDDCIKRDLKIKTSIAPLQLIARSNTEDFSHGFVKLICDNKRKIIGASIVSPEASSLIGELAIAIKYGMTVDEIINIIHPFLGWSEAIRAAAYRIK